MGIDISGAIECRPGFGFLPDPEVAWEFAIDLAQLNCSQSYDAFGCLLGVANYAGFTPIAAERGLPSDIADRTRQDHARYSNESFAQTWVTWAELDAVDWDEPAERPDARVHRYLQDADGGWVMADKSSWNRDLAQVTGVSLADATAGTPVYPEGTQWRIGNQLFRSERLIRRDAVPATGAWAPVWTVMRTLADLHGGDNVRLIVWFDR